MIYNFISLYLFITPWCPWPWMFFEILPLFEYWLLYENLRRATEVSAITKYMLSYRTWFYNPVL